MPCAVAQTDDQITRGRAPVGPARAARRPASSRRVRASLALATVSYCGDWFTTIAIVTVMLTRLGAAGPACYIAARTLPRPLGAFLGGRASDRWGPRRAVVGTLVAQSLIGAALAACVGGGPTTALVVLVVASQVAGAMVQPAFAVVVARAGEAGGLQRRMAANSRAVAVSMVVAPLLGGALLAGTTAGIVVAVDAASFLLPAAGVLAVRLNPDGGSPAGGRAAAGTWELLRRTAWLRRLAVARAGNTAMVTATQAVLALFAAEVLGDVRLLGLLYSAVGAGAVVGAALAPRLSRWPGLLDLATVAEGGLLIGLLAARNAGGAVAVLAASSALGTVYQVAAASRIAAEVDDRLTGRAIGVVYAFAYAGMVAGAALPLLMIGALGWRLTLAVIGAATLLLTAAATLHAPAERGETVTSPPESRHEPGRGRPTYASESAR